MGRLDGKRALVSGTGGGIGRATALLLAREGAHVVGCDLNEETSAETVRLARAAGGTMDAVASADLGTEEGARSWVETAAGLAGGIDILVNNAAWFCDVFGLVPELALKVDAIDLSIEMLIHPSFGYRIELLHRPGRQP